ncbi:MAG: hypothetical protein AB7V42_04405 [Thermoleophilia bacterium]
MATRRKPRKGVGPPPAHSPKRAAEAGAASARGAKAAPPKRKPGEPVPASFKGVAIRALIVAALFYPYLIYIAGEDPGTAFVVTLVAFVLMLPLGMAFDRFRYKRQMKRWEERRAAARPGAR